ncbi:uncharacterized protein LOC108095099 [Drosophila ficusphila]|uniref:uncharacterized protein LOC108095099 n=1 Tax=Drosophila ficusphila TaxID=30025 RepID=UPI001C8A98F0|nr:uncharacterized protein LOC108095099 [Drosophila ficusphila]
MHYLQQIGAQQLEDLKQVYSREWPKYCKEYYCLDTFVDLHRKIPQQEDVKVYALTDLELGLFVIVDRCQIFVGYLESERSESLLEKALLQLDLLGGEQFSSMPKRYFKVANDVLQAKNLKTEIDSKTYSLVLAKEDARKFQVEPPEGFSLKSLSVDDAPFIDSQWDWSDQGTLYFLQRHIFCNTSVGLFNDEDNELVAWCVRAQDGLLAALQVKPSYKRRGFGALVVKEFSRREALQGRDIITEVTLENKASFGLFTKLGFKVNDQCHWLFTEDPSRVIKYNSSCT